MHIARVRTQTIIGILRAICSGRKLQWEPHPTGGPYGREPAAGRFWRETFEETHLEDLRRNDGVRRLLVVLTMWSGGAQLNASGTRTAKPLCLSVLNLDEAGRNSDRGKVGCLVYHIVRYMHHN